MLQRIGFQRRAATTSKVEIPDSAKKEAGLQHHYRITSIVEKHKIPEPLVINSDQTPSKDVQVRPWRQKVQRRLAWQESPINEKSPSH